MDIIHRPLQDIALEITNDWKKPYYGAIPYLEAMHSLHNIRSMYYHDSARSVVLYFLANANSWKGETARRIKKELNTIVEMDRKAQNKGNLPGFADSGSI